MCFVHKTFFIQKIRKKYMYGSSVKITALLSRFQLLGTKSHLTQFLQTLKFQSLSTFPGEEEIYQGKFKRTDHG